MIGRLPGAGGRGSSRAVAPGGGGRRRWRRLVVGGLALAAGLAAAGGGAAPAQAASCPRAVGVSVALPTANASALRRVGVVRLRVRRGARLRDLRVELRRGGRTVAAGARRALLTRSGSLRLRFVRAPVAGAVRVVLTGRRPGCAGRRSTIRTVRLDGHDLPLRVVAGDRDAGDGRLEVTLVAAAGRTLSDVEARLLDERGLDVAMLRVGAPLRGTARPAFALARPLTAGRYAVLVTGLLDGETRRRVTAEAIVVRRPPPAPSPRRPGAPAQPAPAPELPPAPGAVVQQTGVAWSGGQWQGRDSAGFSVPGIGEGVIVCRPDTQWIRVLPSDRARDVAMTLWTVRDWEAGGESTVRESHMTAFTAPEFNEGLNKFDPPEKRAHGTFVGLVGDGLPVAGAFGAGRSPTEVRLSYSWDFTDPASASCSVSATFVSAGPGLLGSVARGLALGYNGTSGVPAEAGQAIVVPGVGTVAVRCDPALDGLRALVVAPDAAIAPLLLTTYEGSIRSDRALGDVPYLAPLPNNGLIELTAPGVRALVASRWKVNDPEPSENHCRASALVVAG